MEAWNSIKERMWSWCFVKNKLFEENGPRMEDNCRKAIAWHLVSYKMTSYHILDEKTVFILSLRFVPSRQSAVSILYPVCSLPSAVCILYWPLSQSIPSALVSLIVTCGIAERLEFTAGFEAVLEDEDKSLDASLSNSDALPLVPSSIFTDDTSKARQSKTKWPSMMNNGPTHGPWPSSPQED